MCICFCLSNSHASKFEQKPIAEIVPNRKRKCTDVPCFITLSVVIFIEIYLIVFAIEKGADPDSLLYGYDYKGDYCNEDNENGKLNAWVNPNEDEDIRICVHTCEQTEFDSRMVYKHESEELFETYCFPLESDFSDLTNFPDWLEREISDINRCKWIILISSFLAIIFGFIYLRSIEKIGAYAILTGVVAFYCGGIIAAWMLIARAADNLKDEETEDNGIIQLTFGILIILVLFCCCFCLKTLRARIESGLIILDQASESIQDMKEVLLFPVLYVVPVLIFISCWIIEALCIYSVKESHSDNMPSWLNESSSTIVNTNNSKYEYYTWDFALQSSFWIHFIILLYAIDLLNNYSYMVLSCTFADWYFSDWMKPNKSRGIHYQERKKRGRKVSELDTFPIIDALWKITRYHLGSLAYASLMISFSRALRRAFMYAIAITDGKNPKINPFARCICCCCFWCNDCIERIISESNKNGLIFVSIYGKNFNYSSDQAFKLVLSNVTRTAIVEGIAGYVEFIGRLSIALLSTGLGMLLLLYNDMYKELNSTLILFIIIFLTSYLIGSLFMMILEVSVETIFLCYLVDERVNSPNKPRFASDELMHLANKYDGKTGQTGSAGGAAGGTTILLAQVEVDNNNNNNNRRDDNDSNDSSNSKSNDNMYQSIQNEEEDDDDDDVPV